MPEATQACLSYLPDTGWEIEGSKWLATVATSLIPGELKHPPDMSHPLLSWASQVSPSLPSFLPGVLSGMEQVKGAKHTGSSSLVNSQASPEISVCDELIAWLPLVTKDDHLTELLLTSSWPCQP